MGKEYVILELRSVDIHAFSCQHTYDVILEPVIIHLYVRDDSIVGTRSSPVTSTNATLQGLHYRIGIVDGFFPAYFVSVIPCL